MQKRALTEQESLARNESASSGFKQDKSSSPKAVDEFVVDTAHRLSSHLTKTIHIWSEIANDYLYQDEDGPEGNSRGRWHSRTNIGGARSFSTASSSKSATSFVASSGVSASSSVTGPFDENDEIIRHDDGDPTVYGAAPPMARMRDQQIAEAITLSPSPAPRIKQMSEEELEQRHQRWRRKRMELAKGERSRLDGQDGPEEQAKTKGRSKSQRNSHKIQTTKGRTDHRNLLCTTKFLGDGLMQELLKRQCGDVHDSLSLASDDIYTSDESEAPTTPSREYETTNTKTNRSREDSRDKRRPEGEISSAGIVEDGTSNVASFAALAPSVEHHSKATHEQSATIERKSELESVDLQDKNFVHIFSSVVSQEGYPLIWHKPSLEGAADITQPVEILAFLERGFREEDGSMEGPRLAWYSRTGNLLGAVDLLDIKSLNKADPLQLSEFPFAMPGKSMLMRFQNAFDELVLEANTAPDAQRFIHGLRWVVARLTFNLIIGNRDVSCELLEISDIGPREYVSAQAMDHVTNQLVDKAVFCSPRHKMM